APVDLRWLAPLILAVLVIGGFFLRRYQKRKESKTAPASHKKAERQRLLHEILQLDDAFAAGNVGETDYLMSREKLKKEVLALEGSNGESSAAEAVETREVNHAAK
nr:cytochrome c-type biogenesis protein CcmH [candidate division KSB1 bacterium]NIR69034.1 cytochrome c-type biogenesis protein CcmH [candidate division KSB1 bacterium]NIS25602.1 cytochrome c-type biogenesis protein CcmH [candidate division KSB1 bacterium]NIT73952.1 cytochrome c-type biogenesis protein CcmH [candidate division KSB1 bacterium]NIU26279.1 cytochrome c-type biogenesis protein CcmH [candidate division KSB1 bacterium]